MSERQFEIDCPHCGHVLTDDEMAADRYKAGSSGSDLWAIAPNEERARVICPSASCGKPFHVRGGYIPKYTTAINEDELE